MKNTTFHFSLFTFHFSLKSFHLNLHTMFKFLKINILCVLLFACFALQAQNKTLKIGDNVKIETQEGTTFIGNVQAMTDEEVTLKQFNSDTKITLQKKNIRQIRAIADKSIVAGEYQFENPNATRYLFAPSSFNLRKGEGYYQNAYIGINTVNYGITDNFTIGGGIELFSTLSGNPSLMLTPKVNFPISEKFNVGAGALLINIGGLSTRTTAGILFGTATVGDRETNATVGGGWGFVKQTNNTNGSGTPVFTVCGMTRLAPRWALVSENWIVTAKDVQFGIISAGARYMRESFTIDFAFWRPVGRAGTNDIGIPALPYIDIVLPFGTR
jgi:hypothetical protein